MDPGHIQKRGYFSKMLKCPHLIHNYSQEKSGELNSLSYLCHFPTNPSVHAEKHNTNVQFWRIVCPNVALLYFVPLKEIFQMFTCNHESIISKCVKSLYFIDSQPPTGHALCVKILNPV